MNNQQKRKGKEPIKVKYISNPIMVKASNETEFRAVVQELTGKTSNKPGPSVGRTANAARKNRVPNHANSDTVLGTAEEVSVSSNDLLASNLSAYELNDIWKIFSRDL